MEMLNVVLVSDPTQTQKVSPNSWKHWGKVKGLDPNEFRCGAGTAVWQLVDQEYLNAAKNITAAPRKPIQMPEEIRRIVAQPVDVIPTLVDGHTHTIVAKSEDDPTEPPPVKEPVPVVAEESPKPKAKKGK